MPPLKNTIITQWVIFGITLAAGILGLVAQFLGAGNFAPASIVSLIAAALLFVLTIITKGDQRAIQAQMRRLMKK